MRLALVVLLLQACACERVGFDSPIVLAPAVAEGFSPQVSALWSEIVAEGASAWSSALAAAGCDATIEVSDDGDYPVVLHTRGTWPHESWEAGHLSSARGVIDIRTRAPLRRTLPVVVHELGHALGLGHRDGDSTMTPIVGELVEPTAADAIAACETVTRR